MTDGFRREAQNKLDREIGPKGERLEHDVKLEVDADTTKAKVKVTRLAEELRNKDVKLNVSVDYDGVRRAREQIDQALKSLDNKVLSFKMNPESIAAARRELKKIEKSAKVDFTFVQDEAGYQSILKKIKKIREEKNLTTTWNFKTDEKSLRRAENRARQALAQIEANKTITLSYAQNYDGIKNAIADIDKRLDALRQLKLKTKLDADSLSATKAALLSKLAVAPITVKFNEDKQGYETILSRIKELQREKAVKEIKFATDDASLEQAARDAREKIELHLRDIPAKLRAAIDAKDIEEAKHQAKELKDHIDHMKGSMQVELAGSELTSARLNYLGRDRVVNYIARVNERSVAVAEGLLKSLGGINTIGSIGKTLEGVFTKFDNYSLKMTALGTAVAALVNTFTYLGTAAFRIGEGVTQSLGLLAAAPAVLGAATVGYTIFTAAFNNFFDAFNKDPQIAKSALAELPPLARKTVESITGLYKGLANPIQERFWKRVGTTLSDSIEKLYPNLKSALLDSTDAVGDFVAGFGRSMNKLAISGDLDKMFAGFKGFFVNLSKASEPFFDAWNKFGVQGAQLLPQFGDWVAKIAVRFDNWATSLGKAGIQDMIMRGVHSLTNMWQVGGSVVDMFKAITRASGAAGSGGLAQFNLTMRRIADQMLGEPWQSRAATIFDGARKGASLLNVGFQDLLKTFGESSVWLGKVLTQLGDIGGNTLKGLSDMLGSQKYQAGITAELEGVQRLTESLRPSFKMLGDVIGDMGKVAGAVFKDMGPVINQLMTIVSNTTNTISDNLAKVAPKMLGTVRGILAALEPVVDLLATSLNGLLGLLSGVSNDFVGLGVAAAAFFAMRGLASKFFDTFKQTSTFQNMESQWVANELAAGRYVDKMKMVNGVWTNVRVPTEKFSATQAVMENVTGATGRWRDRVDELNRSMAGGNGMPTMMQQMRNMGTASIPGIQKALGGLLDFMGGPWGLGFAAAGLVIGAFAQQQADAKRHVEAMTQAIDEQTGKMSKQGLEEMAKRWTDIGEADDAIQNLMRGAKGADQTVQALGFSISDMTLELSKGGEPAKALAEKWRKLGDAMTVLENAGNARRPLDQVKADAENAANALGLTTDKLREHGISAKDVQHVADNLKYEADKATVARLVFEGLGKATGTTSIAAEQMAAAMQTIGDKSIDASGKIGAINKALDLLKGGGKMSARDAEANAQTVFQNAVSQAEAMRADILKTQGLFKQTDGMIDLTTTTGLKLRQTMASMADGVKIEAQAAYDAAIARGDGAAVAASKALEIIGGGQKKLEDFAKAAGLDTAQIQKDWDSFFGKNWELTAVFSANADKFQAAKKAVEEAGGQWNESVFMALLQANPDPAKWTLEGLQAQAVKYATDQYIAQLQAMNPQALQSILEATGQADNYKKGDYTAVMKALNSTDPGVQAAWAALMSVKGGPNGAGWKAALEAYVTALDKVEQDLQNATKPRKISIFAQVTGVDLSGIPDTIRRPTSGPGSGQANGAIYAANGMPLRGFGPTSMVNFRQFADGGFHGLKFEKPGAAKLYPGSDTWRVFAERSTGGEAFIPLAASKRGRSTQILSEVANQFGYKLQKAVQFEDGGVTTGGTRSNSGLSVHIGTYNQNSNDTVDDVGRGIMRKVRSSQLTLEGF